jgi:uncharacterized protein YhfF
MDDWGSIGGDRDDAAIAAFWEEARTAAGLIDVAVPAAWSFGDIPALADELLGLVLDGTKTATASLLWYYEEGGETMPAVGDLSIILDSGGTPRALIRTSEIEIVPFGKVTAEHAFREGEGDRTLDTWRVEHTRFWERTMPEGQTLSPETLMVCEGLELLHPSPEVAPG